MAFRFYPNIKITRAISAGCRYLATKQVTDIHLTPVTDRHMKPGYPRWRYRRNVLGSILLWANRAGAVRIEFREDEPTPFRYYDSTGKELETEMGQPPARSRDNLFNTLILETINGPPLLRVLRGLLFRSNRRILTATFVAKDTDFGDSTWTMQAEGTNAVFIKQANS